MEQAGPPEVPDSGAPAGGVVVPLEPQHLPGQNVSHLAAHHRTDWVVSLESLNRFKCQIEDRNTIPTNYQHRTVYDV